MRFPSGHRPLVTAAAIAIASTLIPLAARQASDNVDYDAIYRIKG